MGLSDIINRIKSALGMDGAGGRRQRQRQRQRGRGETPPQGQAAGNQPGQGRGRQQQPGQGRGRQQAQHQQGGHQQGGTQAQRATQPAGDGQRSAEEGVDVTVEREPATESEDAVKGTDTSDDSHGGEPVTESIAAEEIQNGTGETDEADAETDEESVETESGTDESVDVIKGIGPTYADRLTAAGIETVADLAEADADVVVETADVPKGRLENWIERARHR